MMGKRWWAAVAVICTPTIAFGGVWWNNPDATSQTGRFSWANGQNATDAFGSPVSISDTLWFSSANFDAYSGNGSTSTVEDTMNVDLLASEGYRFDSISWPVYGDYSVTGGAGNSISAEMTMTADVPGDHPSEPFSDSFLLTASGPTTGGVLWEEMVVIDFTSADPPVTEFHLTIDFTTTTISDGVGGTASMDVNLAGPLLRDTSGLEFGLSPIPEPATVILLILGLPGVLKRGKR